MAPTPRSARSVQLINKDLLSPNEINVVLSNISDGVDDGGTWWDTCLGKKTWSRYLITNYFQHWRWYNPNIGKNTISAESSGQGENVNLAQGWAFFEHYTLPRHLVGDSSAGGISGPHGSYIRARAGETSDTELYSVFLTPLSAFADWGIGVSMYFSTLAAIGMIFVVVGCLNVANIMYYSSAEYDPAKNTENSTVWELMSILRYSAMCLDREWVVCEGCEDGIDNWENLFADEFYGRGVDSNGEEVTLISRTTCDMAVFDAGMWNFGTMLLLILAIMAFQWYLSKLEVRYDEDNTSAPDYTVMVRNPPPDALDPEEWRDFFDQFSSKQVTLCTIALDNERLLNKLVQRRKAMKQLRARLGVSDINVDDKAEVDALCKDIAKRREKSKGCFSKLMSPFVRCFGCGKTEVELWEKLQATTEEIKVLQQQEYDVAAVYVTFETEQGQRNALSALNATRTELIFNKAITLDPVALFRDKVLDVVEASEPTAVRWTDLNYSYMSMNFRALLTFIVTIGLVIASAVILQLCRLRVGTTLYAFILSTLNFIIPFTVRNLIYYERHFDEGSMQRSLYGKITLFRWVNTAYVTRVLTPFVATLGADKNDMINTVNALLMAEIIYTPLLNYFDVFEILNRHYFAPRATTKEELFSCFDGGWYNIAEKFTNFTKILLLGIFYSPFMPLIYFQCALIYFVQFWMDKFLLLRSWKKAPLVGTETARFSRQYFTTAAIVIGVGSAAYAYFRSPFSQLCPCDEDEECTVSDTTFSDVALLNGTTVSSIETSNQAVKFCNQDYYPFPPVPESRGEETWMTDGQAMLTRFYGYFFLVVVIFYILGVVRHQIVKFVISCCKPMYKPLGVDQRKDFSSGIGVESFGYIPQLVVPGFHVPFLACNIDDIDVDLISWCNPHAVDTANSYLGYDDYNLIFDVPMEGAKRAKGVESTIGRSTEQDSSRPVFSIVKQWRPDWAQNKNKNE